MCIVVVAAMGKWERRVLGEISKRVWERRKPGFGLRRLPGSRLFHGLVSGWQQSWLLGAGPSESTLVRPDGHQAARLRIAKTSLIELPTAILNCGRVVFGHDTLSLNRKHNAHMAVEAV